MASDTAPAAVPEPVGQPATDTTTGPATGPVAGLLAPIEPARPNSATFNLDPSAIAPAGTFDQAPASASSSTYQNDTDSANTKDGKNNSKQQTGVMRAFALAAIERWKKGADARNKRLDIQKAKANAHQTKEARTVNRSEKFVGGSTNSGSASGKSLDSKAKKGADGPKSGSQKNAGSKKDSSGSGSGGRSGSGAASGSGGTAGGRGSSGPSGHGASGNGNSGTSPKTSKSDPKGHNESSRTSADGKKDSGKNNAGAKTDTATCGDSSGISLTKDKKSKNHDSKSDTRKNGRTDTADAKGSNRDTTSGKTSNGKDTDRASTKPPSASDAKSGTDPKKVDLQRKDTKTGKTRRSSKDDKPAKDSQPKDSTPAAAKTVPINTQPSREAGYRDGSRTAKATAHVKAYRDGFKDGHHDTSEAAEREKKRLDEAHEARKQQRAKDQPVTASSADHQPQGPQPIDVKEVTDTHVTLDGGKTYTRGEVRNLKQYERRMTVKATNMGKAAEGTRQLQAHAEQQADKALKFLEMAKTVEGGDRFVGILTRLHEAATIQIRQAQELHKRVVRAAENTRVVLANVETRYGGIYKAVCESPLTKPAELNWYRK